MYETNRIFIIVLSICQLRLGIQLMEYQLVYPISSMQILDHRKVNFL